jgi:hypothetical protein
MGVFEELVNNKEELIVKLLKILEGKEASTKLNLDNIEFMVGNNKVRINGTVNVTVTPQKGGKKSKK